MTHGFFGGWTAFVGLAALLTVAACAAAPQPAVDVGGPAPPPRISMAQLHAAGGVPPGWHFTPPAGDAAAGRQAFVDFGCTSCHTVQEAVLPRTADAAPPRGPDLSGMGSHHPAEYFAESILNPNAVIVDGPAAVGPDGRSTMPAYPDMTLRQLADLVAYLQSLTGSGAHTHVHRPGPPAGDTGASTFFVQAYALAPDRLDEFYAWFDREEFRKYPGLLSVQTFVGRRQAELLVVAVFGFDTELAMGRFVKDVAGASRPKDFAAPVQRYILRSPALYKANGMSLP